MNCPYCGKQLNTDATFCVNCYRALPAGSMPSNSATISQNPSIATPTSAPSSNYSRQQWEYSVVEFALTNDGYYLLTVNNIQQERKLGLAAYSNMVGQEGWELVSSVMARRAIPKTGRVNVSDLIHGATKDIIDVLTLMFKRPK